MVLIRNQRTRTLAWYNVALLAGARINTKMATWRSRLALLPTDRMLTRLCRRHLTTSDWKQLSNGVRVRNISLGNQDDKPVGEGQSVRVEYVARLDDGSEIVACTTSFKQGKGSKGSICAAIDEGVLGMCVGDRRKLRAPPFMPRSRALAMVPKDVVLRTPSACPTPAHEN